MYISDYTQHDNGALNVTLPWIFRELFL